MMPTKEQLFTLALQQAPTVIRLVKTLFQVRHPEAPEPTDAEVIAAWDEAFRSSIAKDDRWLAEHPRD